MSTSLVTKVGAVGNQANFATDTSGTPIGLVNPTGGMSQIQSVKEKFCNSLQKGATYREYLSLLAAPAWTVSTSYQVGMVVQNAGNDYTCIGDGVSTGAPTGTSNTATGTGALWLYMGAASAALADQSNVPTLTSGTIPASLTVRYNPAPSGVLGPAYNAFWFSGSVMAPSVPWGGGDAVAGQGQWAINVTSVEFYTDAPMIAINANANSAAGLFLNLMIDGRPLYPRYGYADKLAANLTPGGFTLDWTSKPKKVRHVKLYIGNQNFTGVNVAPPYSVWQPNNPNRYRLWTEGDSFYQGATPTNGTLSRGLRLANLLGCDDVWGTATGNSGYIWAGSGSTMQLRTPQIIANAPDILFTAPYTWDSNYTSAQRKTAYKLYWDTLFAALPNLIILAGGSVTGGDVETDMREAVAAYNHPHLKFIASSPDVNGVGWVTGNGTVTNAGTIQGNSQWIIGNPQGDDHPNYRALEMWQWREYNNIVNAINSIKS